MLVLQGSIAIVVKNDFKLLTVNGKFTKSSEVTMMWDLVTEFRGKI
jgi:hypothetical protein